MAEYDLTSKMAPYMDRHLVFPLLEFLSERELYDREQLLASKLELLNDTNMVDFVVESLERDPTKEEAENFKRKRENVVCKLKELQDATEPIVCILQDDEVEMQIQNTADRDGRKLLEYLQTKHGFHPDMLDILYNYAKFQYECGNYSGASEYLYFYRLLVPQNHNHTYYLYALWGKLASEILLQNWDVAKDDLLKVKAYIDQNPFETELEWIQHRAWLIHWSLFVHFNHPKGRDDIVDMVLNTQSYLNTVQILCPHILRYLAVAVVTSKRRRQTTKELTKLIEIISAEHENFADPITEFLECLFVHYDFDTAQKKLRECEKVLLNDFFVSSLLEEFMDSARVLIFEMFCRIHQKIGIKMLSEKLNMELEEAECWIVNLIRNAQLDAKIDSTLGQVIMGRKGSTIHEQVMENTKRLSFRAQSMAFQLEKIEEKQKVLNRRPQPIVALMENKNDGSKTNNNKSQIYVGENEQTYNMRHYNFNRFINSQNNHHEGGNSHQQDASSHQQQHQQSPIMTNHNANSAAHYSAGGGVSSSCGGVYGGQQAQYESPIHHQLSATNHSSAPTFPAGPAAYQSMNHNPSGQQHQQPQLSPSNTKFIHHQHYFNSSNDDNKNNNDHSGGPKYANSSNESNGFQTNKLPYHHHLQHQPTVPGGGGAGMLQQQLHHQPNRANAVAQMFYNNKQQTTVVNNHADGIITSNGQLQSMNSNRTVGNTESSAAVRSVFSGRFDVGISSDAGVMQHPPYPSTSSFMKSGAGSELPPTPHPDVTRYDSLFMHGYN